MNEVYTSSQARAKLGGMSTSSFKNLIDSGKIRKVTPPNKKQGFYMKEDVDKIAEAMQQFVEIYTVTQPGEKYEVVQAQNESEIRATAQIARQHFGDLAYTTEERVAWFRKVPDGDYVLKHNGVVVGYFSIQAVTHEALEDHIYKPNGGGVQLNDLQPFTPGKPLECYVTGMATKLGVDRKPDRYYGMHLLVGLMNTLADLGRRGIDIRKVWTKSRTVSGIKLCRDFGFTELGYIDSEHIGFLLDLQVSEIPAIKRYRDILKEANVAEVK